MSDGERTQSVEMEEIGSLEIPRAIAQSGRRYVPEVDGPQAKREDQAMCSETTCGQPGSGLHRLGGACHRGEAFGISSVEIGLLTTASEAESFATMRDWINRRPIVANGAARLAYGGKSDKLDKLWFLCTGHSVTITASTQGKKIRAKKIALPTRTETGDCQNNSRSRTARSSAGRRRIWLKGATTVGKISTVRTSTNANIQAKGRESAEYCRVRQQREIPATLATRVKNQSTVEGAIKPMKEGAPV